MGRITGTIENIFSLSNGNLSFNQIKVLEEVPENVYFSSFSSICQSSTGPNSLFQRAQRQSHRGGFLGFTKTTQSDMHTNSLGKFTDRKFLSIFRFKLWWSTMWVGKSSSDLQMETQWILLNIPEVSSYMLILPIIEGKFRSCINPGQDGDVTICAESGSSEIIATKFSAIAYVHVSDNPYSIMREAYTAVRVYLDTFRILEEKSVPSIVDRFGWCTWDAFYFMVEPNGVFHGVKEFYEAGVPLWFLIIDDGWQTNKVDGAKNGSIMTLTQRAEGIPARLSTYEENEKFRNYVRGSLLDPNANYDTERLDRIKSKSVELQTVQTNRDKAIHLGKDNSLSDFDLMIEILKKEIDEIDASYFVNEGQNGEELDSKRSGMRAFINDLKTRFPRLDDVYVWQSVCGSWGGVSTGADAIGLNSEVVSAKPSTCVARTMFDGAYAKCLKHGVGLVHPSQTTSFFNSMHSYLASAGVSGVKVDVTNMLELLGEKYNGRVELAKAYYEGLSDSLTRNFNGNGLISSMQHCNDFFFLGTRQISLGRVGDDFWNEDPNGDPNGIYWLQGVLMVHCAYNSMWMGQTVQPDWDMFKSDHPCAAFHAASRAICGGPIYVSDSVGSHDFDLIKRLVFRDGTVPRCQHFALPTRDCLFANILFDGETALKIWNLNKFGGVIGAFNCQGAGWDPRDRRIRSFPDQYKLVTCTTCVTEIEWDQRTETESMAKAKEYAVYLHQAKIIELVSINSDPITVALQPSSFEIFTFVPVRELGTGVKVAPIGLVNMLNSGGTVLEIETGEGPEGVFVATKVKGEGTFLVYSNKMPKKAVLNGVQLEFEWKRNRELVLDIPWVECNNGVSVLYVTY